MLTPNTHESPDQDHGFQIAPMVDVVFVLLLFFMALAGMKQIERFLTVEVPSQTKAGIVDPPIVVDIFASGEVACNGKLLLAGADTDPAVFREWLLTVAQADAGTSIIIRPAADATHERFVLVLSTIKKSGLKKISFS